MHSERPSTVDDDVLHVYLLNKISLKSCCCGCFSLREGAFYMSIIFLIWCLIATVFFVMQVYYFLSTNYENVHFDKYNSYGALIIYLLGIPFTIDLMYGIIQLAPQHILPWIYYITFVILIRYIAGIYYLVFVRIFFESMKHIIMASIFLYLDLVALSLYWHIRIDEELAGREQLQDERQQIREHVQSRRRRLDVRLEKPEKKSDKKVGFNTVNEKTKNKEEEDARPETSKKAKKSSWFSGQSKEDEDKKAKEKNAENIFNQKISHDAKKTQEDRSKAPVIAPEITEKGGLFRRKSLTDTTEPSKPTKTKEKKQTKNFADNTNLEPPVSEPPPPPPPPSKKSKSKSKRDADENVEETETKPDEKDKKPEEKEKKSRGFFG